MMVGSYQCDSDHVNVIFEASLLSPISNHAGEGERRVVSSWPGDALAILEWKGRPVLQSTGSLL